MKFLFILIFNLIIITICNAQIFWQQIGSDIDGEAIYDYSGYGVKLNSDGTVVAIGAAGNGGGGIESGHVRVYELISGSWVQKGNDIDGEAAGDKSGHSVSISSDGSIVAIGAPYNSGNGIESGHVRVYKYINPDWVQMGNDIDGEAMDDRSGKSLSLSSDGSIIAIGAYLNDGSGTNAGHVRVYEFDGSNWVQKGSDIDGEAPGDYSGIFLSLNFDGNIIAIGASNNAADSINSFKGHVRVYEFDGSNWVQKGSDIDGEATGDHSGSAVNINSDGTIVAIGAGANDGNGNSSGHVRVYEFNGSDWVQMGNDIDGESNGDYFGTAVFLSSDGNILAAGAPFNAGNGSSSGHVRVFKYNGIYWVQIGNDIDGENMYDGSGQSIGMSDNGSVIAIGAINNDELATDAGHVRIFKNCNTESIIYESACINYLSPSGNYIWTNTGTYYDTIPNHAGCDSIITINLTVNQINDATFYYDNPQYCMNEQDPMPTIVGSIGGVFSSGAGLVLSSTSGTIDLSECTPGNYTVSYMTIGPCPDTCYVNITILSTSIGFETITVCNSYISPSGYYSWDTTGIYYDTLQNIVGCDSVITIDLTVYTVDTSVIQNDTELTANTVGADYQWIYCDSSYAVIPGETNQNYFAIADGNYAVIITEYGCTDTSGCINVNCARHEYFIRIDDLIFPNPTTGIFKIGLDDFDKIEIYNNNGQIIMETVETEVDISSYPAGLYYIRIVKGKNTIIGEIIKE